MSKFVHYPEPNQEYRHYKGGRYIVLSMATHSETQEPLVIYKSILFGSIFARPLPMWFELVTLEDGTQTSRFTRI